MGWSDFNPLSSKNIGAGQALGLSNHDAKTLDSYVSDVAKDVLPGDVYDIASGALQVAGAVSRFDADHIKREFEENTAFRNAAIAAAVAAGGYVLLNPATAVTATGAVTTPAAAASTLPGVSTAAAASGGAAAAAASGLTTGQMAALGITAVGTGYGIYQGEKSLQALESANNNAADLAKTELDFQKAIYADQRGERYGYGDDIPEYLRDNGGMLGLQTADFQRRNEMAQYQADLYLSPEEKARRDALRGKAYDAQLASFDGANSLVTQATNLSGDLLDPRTYAARARSSSWADSSTAHNALTRDLARMGVNPASGAWQNSMRTSRVQAAADAAKAGNSAYDFVTQENYKRRKLGFDAMREATVTNTGLAGGYSTAAPNVALGVTPLAPTAPSFTNAINAQNNAANLAQQNAQMNYDAAGGLVTGAMNFADYMGWFPNSTNTSTTNTNTSTTKG